VKVQTVHTAIKAELKLSNSACTVIQWQSASQTTEWRKLWYL